MEPEAGVSRVIFLQTMGGATHLGHAAGGSFHTSILASEWSRRGINVDLITSPVDEGILARSARLSVHVVETPAWDWARHPAQILLSVFLAWFACRSQVDYILGRIGPDPTTTVAVAASPYPSDVLSLWRIHRRWNLPGIVQFYHLPPSPAWHASRRGGIVRSTVAWLLGTLALLVVKIADLYPSINSTERSTLQTWRFRRPVIITLSILQSDSFSNSDEGADRPIDACFLSRMTRVKGVLDLLEAWSLVVRERPSSSVVLAGAFLDQRFEDEVQRRIGRLGLAKNVTIHGYVSQATKASLLGKSKLFLFPSYEEGWSVAVMEAAASGAVPVTYDLQAYDYLGNGIVRVPVGDREALARAALALLNDPENTRRLSQIAIGRARRFTPAFVAEFELEELGKILF